jgi:hypothetical protein
MVDQQAHKALPPHRRKKANAAAPRAPPPHRRQRLQEAPKTSEAIDDKPQLEPKTDVTLEKTIVRDGSSSGGLKDTAAGSDTKPLAPPSKATIENGSLANGFVSDAKVSGLPSYARFRHEVSLHFFHQLAVNIPALLLPDLLKLKQDRRTESPRTEEPKAQKVSGDAPEGKIAALYQVD